MRLRRITAFLTGILLVSATVLAPVTDVLAKNETTAVKKSNYVIKDMSSANSALSLLANDQKISALVYLKDAYTIRSEADAYSDRVACVASGQLVYIKGVDEDNGRNIWYKVEYDSDSGKLSGYIEREFLACSDERLLAWEEKYITTLKREATSSETDCSDIETFPESYKDALYELKKKHPDWIFVKMNTGLDFNSSVRSEGTGAYSLIETKRAKSSWIEGKYDNSWSYATDGIIAYYMDPRNFLTETQIFMFEQQTYNRSYHTESSVQKILNGTFMAGNVDGESITFAAAFMNYADRYNISPILQAARVLQEQGSGQSPLISGTYPGYEGYYNYYNIGAVSSNPIGAGLAYAKEKGWNSRLKSLEAGAGFLCKSYIGKGQDTLYLQKFDVDASYNGVLTHQYMQNIVAPSSEASSAYKGYKNAGLLSNTPFVFRIPVYNNMPSGRSTKPESDDVLTLNMDSVENLPVSQSAVLVPYINGGLSEAYAYNYSSSDQNIASVDDNGVITGKKPGTATITCKAGTAGSVGCTVTVIKADIALSDVERPDLEVTYDPDKTLDDIELTDGFEWADASTVPTVENQGYTAIYSPDNSRFNSLTMTLDVRVNKAVIESSDVEIPSDITATSGAELSTVALPNNYIWEEGSTVLPVRAGSYTYKATYCPDELNYEVTRDIEIPVTVICTEHRFSDWSEPNGGYIERSCEICGETERLEVEEQVNNEDCTTLGHDMVDGVCRRCGYEEPTLQEHSHEYTLSSDTATCTEAGVKTYTCSCGDSYTEESAALGHHMVGNRCDRCDYVYTPTAAVTPIPTSIPTPTAIPTPTSMPTPTSVPTPTAAPAPTTVPTPTSVPTPTAGPTGLVIPEITRIALPTATPTPTAVPTPTAALTPTAVPTPTSVPTPTAAPTPTTVVPMITSIATPTATSAVTPTGTPASASAPTATPRPVAQATPTLAPATATASTPTTTPTPEPVPENPPTTLSSVTPEGKLPLNTNEVPVLPQITSMVKETEPAEDKIKESKPTDATSEDKEITEPETTETKSEASEAKNEDMEITLPAGEGAMWTISDDSVSEEMLAGMDLTVSLDKEDVNIPDKVIDKLKTDDYMLMSIAYDGEFGFDAVLTIDTGKEHTGKYANLYYFNED
ncbi:MAG: Ig-like domain-containing protein, partial [Lachnospiraceae bacterium]|nr:Ig-like domain-containing protein [Lachnospiraceae bacterium]